MSSDVRAFASTATAGGAAIWTRAPAHTLAAALCLGLAAANVARVHVLGLACSVLAAGAVVACESPSARLACAGMLLAALGWWWASERLELLDRSPLSAEIDRAGRAIVVVTAPPRARRYDIRVQARVRRFEGKRVDERVQLELPPGRAPPQGATLEVLAVIRLPRGPDHGFDERTWLRRHGVHVVLHVDDWKLVGRRGGVGGVADTLRRSLARSIAPGLSGERRAVLEGIVLGDDEALSDGLRQEFRASGLYHLLAVSGQNVILVAGGVLVLAWLLGVNRWIGELGALAGIAAYVLAVGAQPSVVRAGIAGSLASLAWIAGRLRDAWYALLLGAIALLAWNPYLVFDAGFQLSFAAVAAIFTLVPRLSRRLEGFPMPAFVRTAVAVSTACGIATAPILWLQFGALPLLSGAGECAGRARDPVPARSRVPDGRPRHSLSRGSRARRVAERLARRLHRTLRPRDRLAPVRADHQLPRARRPRGRRARRGLCLAAMADELKPAYLLAGSDRPKVDRALQRLRGRFASEAVELYTAAELSGEDVVAAAYALGLFAGDGRLLVVDGVETWKADDAKAIAVYLKAPTPATTLALVGGELKKDAPLAKAVAATGELLIWEVAKKGLQGWVSEQFRLHEAHADPDACRALIELVGDDLYELATEVDKLATWAAGEPVTAAAVGELVAARAGANNFALTDAWGARDAVAVLRATEHLLERTPDPRSRTIPRVAATLTSHLGRLRACQALEAEGLTSKDAAARMKQHPFYVQKLYAQARNFTPDELRDATVRLAELDHALKGGSRLTGELELERALVEIAQPRRPTGHAPTT